MNAFQILALGVVAGLFVMTVLAMVKRTTRHRDGFAWASLWLVAGVAIAWPEVTAMAARLLGIGRGADLVLYCAVVVMMGGFLMVYARLRRLQHDITMLVRHLAIREASGDSTTFPAGVEPQQVDHEHGNQHLREAKCDHSGEDHARPM